MTQQLENFPLKLRIIGIRYLKGIIHTLFIHVRATLLLVGIDVCNNPLVIWVLHVSVSVGDACLPGLDLILDSNGT